MRSDRRLSRRSVLRGCGAVLGLPFLEAMVPPGLAARRRRAAPVRLAFLFMPNGVDPDHWTPVGEGRAFELSEQLAPLAPVQDAVLVLSQLTNRASRGGDGHYAKTANLLTSTPIKQTTGRDIDVGGVSIDQVVAAHVGHETALPSLELGIDPVTTGIDRNVNFTRLYGSFISWSSRTSPRPPILDVKLAFDRLFRTPERWDLGAAERDRGILDLVREDAGRLQRRLGGDDRRRVEEYLDAVRALERRIDHASRRGAARAAAPTPDEPAPGEDYAAKVGAMLELIVLAFRADATRVATFLYGNSVSSRDFSFLEGVEGRHHEISHHQNDPDKLRQYRCITRWHVATFARLIERLRSIDDGDGTLLDHSAVVFASGLRDGNRHDPIDLPLLVGGRAGGALQPGIHIASDPETPLAALWLRLGQAAGVPLERFADADAPLAC